MQTQEEYVHESNPARTFLLCFSGANDCTTVQYVNAVAADAEQFSSFQEKSTSMDVNSDTERRHLSFEPTAFIINCTSSLLPCHEWKEDYKQAASDELSCSLDRGWSPPRFGVDWRFQSQESSKPLAGDCSKELQPAMKSGGKLATHSELSHILHRIRKKRGDSWW